MFPGKMERKEFKEIQLTGKQLSETYSSGGENLPSIMLTWKQTFSIPKYPYSGDFKKSRGGNNADLSY